MHKAGKLRFQNLVVSISSFLHSFLYVFYAATENVKLGPSIVF